MVLETDIERTNLLKEYLELEHNPNAKEDRIAEISERLNTIDSHTAESRAEKILAGLGFS